MKKPQQPTIVLSVTNDTFTDQRVHRMARTLCGMGFRVKLVGKRSRQAIRDSDYARVITLPMFFKKKAAFYAEFNIRLFFYLLFCKGDVFTANDLDTLPASSLASWLRRKKLVYDSHEYFTQSPELLHRPFVRKIWVGLEKFLVRTIHKGITVSPSIAQAYKKNYGIDFEVIRNLPLSIPNTSEVNLPDYFFSRPVVLYQGSLNLGRGLEMAIQAMAFSRKAQLVIIGSGDIEKQLKDLTRELNLEHRVFFTGRIAFHQLAAYTAKATIGLSVEEDLGMNYRFALPNKLFDYIQAQVPAIVSDLPEMSNITRTYNTGVILTSHDPRCLAATIDQLLNNPQKLQEIKQNCVLAAKQLCWEKESLKVREIYSELID